MTLLPLRLQRQATDEVTPLRRRDFLAGLLAGALAGCTSRPDGGAALPALPARTGQRLGRTGREVELWSWFDLPAADVRSRELSGIAWDERAGTLWAVQDETPNIVPLVPDRDFKTWTFGETIAVEVGGAVDLEGLVVLPDGFIVCSEVGPRIVEVDRLGRFRSEIPLPARFNEARTNKSLESLTMSPSGRYLFTTTEVALGRDGGRATTSAGTRVRIVRMNRDEVTGGFRQTSEHAYETDPAPFDGSDWGISDLCAVGDDELLVMERGFAAGRGNTVRIYHATLDGRASCLGIDELTPRLPTLDKALRVDLCRLGGAIGLPEPKQPQPTALLDNYEGLSLGPRLPDGRSSLIVVSDDNQRANQVARILVLAV